MKIFRFMKRNYKLALLALLLCTLVQVVSPIAAILEQQLLEDFMVCRSTCYHNCDCTLSLCISSKQIQSEVC